MTRNQEFGLSTLHSRGQSPKVVVPHGNTFWLKFWPKQCTLKGSLGEGGLETQTMVERPSIFFIENKIINNFQPISLDSQQSLATQSHGLLTWTAIVWSSPYSEGGNFFILEGVHKKALQRLKLPQPLDGVKVLQRDERLARISLFTLFPTVCINWVLRLL